MYGKRDFFCFLFFLFALNWTEEQRCKLQQKKKTNKMEMLCKQQTFNGFVSQFSYLLAFNDSVHCVFVWVRRSWFFFISLAHSVVHFTNTNTHTVCFFARCNWRRWRETQSEKMKWRSRKKKELYAMSNEICRLRVNVKIPSSTYGSCIRLKNIRFYLGFVFDFYFFAHSIFFLFCSIRSLDRAHTSRVAVIFFFKLFLYHSSEHNCLCVHSLTRCGTRTTIQCQLFSRKKKKKKILLLLVLIHMNSFTASHLVLSFHFFTPFVAMEAPAAAFVPLKW